MLFGFYPKLTAEGLTLSLHSISGVVLNFCWGLQIKTAHS